MNYLLELEYSDKNLTSEIKELEQRVQKAQEDAQTTLQQLFATFPDIHHQKAYMLRLIAELEDDLTSNSLNTNTNVDKYLNQHSTNELSHEDKTLLREYFRRICTLTHPDKNLDKTDEERIELVAALDEAIKCKEAGDLEMMTYIYTSLVSKRSKIDRDKIYKALVSKKSSLLKQLKSIMASPEYQLHKEYNSNKESAEARFLFAVRKELEFLSHKISELRQRRQRC